MCTGTIFGPLFWCIIWEQSSVWIGSLLFPCVYAVHMRIVATRLCIYSFGYLFLPQKARSLNIHQLLAEESEDKLEEYYRQKYATTSSARLETIVCDVLLCGGV